MIDPSPAETIFSEAERLIYGERNDAYGHPRDDYAQTAKMITGVLLPKLRPGVEVSIRDALLIMVCVKVSREARKHKRDNCTDGAGYWGCIMRAEEDPLPTCEERATD